MTIAQAFNEIAVAQGGTASTSGTIAGAIDALNDALAGSDQASAQTIEDAVRLLGQNIGSGGGGGGSVEHNIICYSIDMVTKETTPIEGNVYSAEIDSELGGWVQTETNITSAEPGEVIAADIKEGLDVIAYGTRNDASPMHADIIEMFYQSMPEVVFVMPDSDLVIFYTYPNVG